MSGGGSEPPHPTVYLSDVEIMRHSRYLRAVLRCLGVDDVDADDVLQETFAGAFVAMWAGRFRPNPAVPLRSAVRMWLAGIAFRQASHHFHRAHRHREVLVGDGVEVAIEPVPDPERRLVARAMLRALARLPPDVREIVARTAVGFTSGEIAEQLRIPVGTVSTRLRRGRRLFLRALTRWRRER